MIVCVYTNMDKGFWTSDHGYWFLKFISNVDTANIPQNSEYYNMFYRCNQLVSVY